VREQALDSLRPLVELPVEGVDPIAMRTVALAFLFLVFLGGCRSDSGVPPRQRDIREQIDKMQASTRPFYLPDVISRACR
jgi:hypothetical protein